MVCEVDVVEDARSNLLEPLKGSLFVDVDLEAAGIVACFKVPEKGGDLVVGVSKADCDRVGGFVSAELALDEAGELFVGCLMEVGGGVEVDFNYPVVAVGFGLDYLG